MCVWHTLTYLLILSRDGHVIRWSGQHLTSDTATATNVDNPGDTLNPSSASNGTSSGSWSNTCKTTSKNCLCSFSCRNHRSALQCRAVRHARYVDTYYHRYLRPRYQYRHGHDMPRYNRSSKISWDSASIASIDDTLQLVSRTIQQWLHAARLQPVIPKRT